MFGEERNLFHLEPVQAIETSFKSIESHSERMHQATALALKYLLNEFSPETLSHRFQAYRKMHRIMWIKMLGLGKCISRISRN